MDPRRPQRLTIVAAALGFGLFQAAGIAATPAATPAAAPAAAAAPAPAATASAGEPAAGDAAAKHAKRTACLKDAKSKKLVGAEKNAFVKSCTAAP
jgi:2-oxoglutarate dehydrogenase E2 component (dihydrolipoamide succinyltransferase)